jgi:hypothetical protein
MTLAPKLGRPRRNPFPRAGVVMLLLLSTMQGPAHSLSDAGSGSTAPDAKDRGRLDIRAVDVDVSEDALLVMIRMRTTWARHLLAPQAKNLLAILFDSDGDGVSDSRGRIVHAGGTWAFPVSGLAFPAAADTADPAAPEDEEVLVQKPDPRTVQVRIPGAWDLPPNNEASVLVRTRFRHQDLRCSPCRDRAPDQGWLPLSSDGPSADPRLHQLRALAGTVVPLGAPFRFRATVHNPTDEAVWETLVPELAPVGSSSSVPFGDYLVLIPAKSSTSVDGTVSSGQWFPDPGPFELRLGDADPLRFDVTSPVVTPPRFVDATESAGVATDHVGTVDCTDYSAGAAWGDADGDGRIDLYLPHHGRPAQLWIQQPDGRFVDQATARGATNPDRIGIGAVFGDYDNDGDQDLYAVNDGPTRLYRNDGTGHFTDVTVAAGVGDPSAGASASWGDYDADGYLDLYVVNYYRCPDIRFDDVLYHNNGDGTFTDVTGLLQATGPTDGLGFQAAWFDYDGDTDVDLYLANDHIGHTVPNVLWRNDGPGGPLGWRFTNVSDASGAGIAMNSMGIGVADYDRDLDLDIAVSNIAPTKLFVNNGQGAFVEQGETAGVARPRQRHFVLSTTWGLSFADFNKDGWEDLYVAGGSLSVVAPEAQPNALFVNAGDGTFHDLSAQSGTDDTTISRGVALADYDRDGRVDIYVVNQWGRPRLFRNVTTGGGHWLKVDLVGTTSNTDACGAWIEVDLPGGGTIARQVFCGSVGLGSGSDTVVHFGLGPAMSVEELRIRWPSGAEQTLGPIAADQLITVTEG